MTIRIGHLNIIMVTYAIYFA